MQALEQVEQATPKTTTPQVAMKAKVSYATTLTGQKTDIGYVQKVGQLKTLKEGQTYSALDLEEERMAKGKRKAETADIEMMFIQETHKAIQAIGMDRTSVYITNVIPWRPLGNRTPTTDEIALYRPFLIRHINIINPKVHKTKKYLFQAMYNV